MKYLSSPHEGEIELLTDSEIRLKKRIKKARELERLRKAYKLLSL